MQVGQRRCPKCEAVSRPGTLGGLTKCPKCGHSFTVLPPEQAALDELSRAIEHAKTNPANDELIDAITTVLYLDVMPPDFIGVLISLRRSREEVAEILAKAHRAKRRKTRLAGLMLALVSLAFFGAGASIAYVTYSHPGKIYAVACGIAVLAFLGFLIGLFVALTGWGTLTGEKGIAIKLNEPLPKVCVVCGDPTDWFEHVRRARLALPVCEKHRWYFSKELLLRIAVWILAALSVPFGVGVAIGVVEGAGLRTVPVGVLALIGVLIGGLWLTWGRKSIGPLGISGNTVVLKGLDPNFIFELQRLRDKAEKRIESAWDSNPPES